MQLYRYELKKIFSSRVVIWLLLCLLIINFGVAYFNTRPMPAKEYEMAVYEMVREDPEGMRAYKDELSEYFLNFIRASEDKEANPEMPKTFFPESPYDDSQLLEVALSYAEVIDGYEERMRTIISTTQRQLYRLRDYGYSENHYSVLSRVKLIETYRALMEQDSRGDDYTYGYDQYLSGSMTTGVLLLVLVTAMVANLFLSEDSYGMRPLAHASVKGRGHTASAKIAAILTVTLVVSLVFFSTSALAVGIRCGYSSPSSDIRLVEGYETVPFAMSIAKYLVCHTALRLVGLIAYAMICVLLASIKLPYLGCFLGGGVIMGAQYLIYSANYLGTTPPIRYINMISLLDGATPLGFYRSVSFFGICVNQLVFLPILGVLIAIGAAVGGVIIYGKNVTAVSAKAQRLGIKLFTPIKAKWADAQEKRYSKRPRAARSYSVALLPYEWSKIRLPLILFAIALLLCVKSAMVADDVGNMRNYFQTRYRAYIADMEGLDEAGQKDYLRDERARLDEIFAMGEEMDRRRENGTVTNKEYYEYQELFHTARSEETVYKELENYVNILHRGNRQSGMESKVIYDIGYNHYFERDMDVYLLIALIALCYGIFTVEYSEKGSQSGFSAILRTTRRGREKTFRAKLTACVPLSALMGLAFRLCDYLTVRHGFEMTDTDAPLYSVTALSKMPMTMTIGNYLLLDFLLSTVAGALFGYLFCALSAALRHKLPTLSAIVVVCGVPALLCSLLSAIPRELALLALSQPQTMYAYICRGTGYFVLLMLIYAVLIGLLLFDRYRRFVGVRSMKI